MTALLIGALDLGAGGIVLRGSPARSIRVFLFEAGSGTVMDVSILDMMPAFRYQQFDPCRL
jgi:hypothetical protein